MTLTSTLTNQLQLAINDQPLSTIYADLLVSLVVESSIYLPDSCVATFVSPTTESSLYETLRASFSKTVTVESASGGGLVFKGEVTAVEVEQDAAGRRFVMRALDRSNRLFHGRTTTAFKDKPASEIVSQLAAEAKLETGVIEPTTSIYTVATQAFQSSWDFIQQLALESGRVAYTALGAFNFVTTPKTTTAPEPGELEGPLLPRQLVLGRNLFRLRATLSAAEQVSSVSMRSWNPATKEPIEGKGTIGTSLASAGLGASPSALGEQFGGNSFVAGDIPFPDEATATAASKALAERLSSEFVEFEGEALGDPSLSAGSAFSIGCAGTPFDGKFVATSVTHTSDGAGYTTSFVVSGSPDSPLGAFPGLGQPERYRHLVSGVVIGKVSNIKDPKQEGRVQVTFPWLDGSYVSDWCRVMQPGAGTGWGTILMPETSSEVLVAFDQGDVRRPYVIGGLYNGQDKMEPPGDLVDDGTGQATLRRLSSRTKQMLLLSDDKTNPGITLQTGDSKHSLKFETQGGGKVTLDSKGDITVSGKSVTVKAEANLTVSAQSITMDAKEQFKATGQSLNLQGQELAVIQSGADMQVKGKIVQIN